jgi:hypothetical protein
MAKAAEWEARVASWRASGLKSEEFCRGRGYSARNLLWWSSQLRRRRAVPAPKASGVQMARVVRSASAPTASTAVLIEADGVRVAVGSDANAETLRAVFEALGLRRRT